MRFTQSEKMEIICLVEQSTIGAKRTLKELQINRSTFYRWYADYLQYGYDGLAPKKPDRRHFWNQIPEEIKENVVKEALDHPDKSTREVALYYTQKHEYYISESSIYRILKAKGLILPAVFEMVSAADEFTDKTTEINQMWQTDFTYFKIKNWGWYYLSTILDDYSRYIVSWKLCKSMTKEDVAATIDLAYFKFNIPREHRPRLLSDNGSCYIAKDLKKYLRRMGMDHVRGAANHPQTQGKIERYHRSMKGILLRDHYTSPEELERRIKKWVDYYNNHRYHESINNLTPADVYFGNAATKLKERQKIKINTIRLRRNNYQQNLVNLSL